jgi:DNA repair protein RadC
MKGIGKVKAIGILAALELGRRRSNFNERKSKVISSSNSAFAQFKVELSDLSHEEFWAIYLSSGSKLIQKKRISSGGIAGTVADVRMILKAGLDCRATALIVAHNHPSGSLKPSEPDIRLTRKLKDASELMDIRLLDHLIIGLNGYYSFADEGLVF